MGLKMTNFPEVLRGCIKVRVITGSKQEEGVDKKEVLVLIVRQSEQALMANRLLSYGYTL